MDKQTEIQLKLAALDLATRSVDKGAHPQDVVIYAEYYFNYLVAQQGEKPNE